jgi:hypothetical protein
MAGVHIQQYVHIRLARSRPIAVDIDIVGASALHN